MSVIRKSRTGLILAVVLLAGFLAGCVGGKPNTSANYNASGTVVDSDGAGIECVLLSFTSTDTNKELGITETEKDGKWSMTGLSGSVRVSPAKEGWEFEDVPKIITKEETDLEFVGKQSENLPQTYDVSGTVVDRDGAGIVGVVLSFSSADTSEDFGEAETDEDGKWGKAGLSGSVYVSLAKEGWEFEGAPKMITKEETDLKFVGELSEDKEAVTVEENLIQLTNAFVEGFTSGNPNNEEFLALFADPMRFVGGMEPGFAQQIADMREWQKENFENFLTKVDETIAIHFESSMMIY